MIPLLDSKYRQINLLFQSIGDAAGFQKYVFQMGLQIPEKVVFTGRLMNFPHHCTMIKYYEPLFADVALYRLSEQSDCAVFITTKNNVGDPVINEVQKICETFPSLTCIFFNCDLSDRVTSGIQARTVRDNFRGSIVPAFYFRNIVKFSRPSQIPYELGALLFTYRRGWEMFAINTDDVPGAGKEKI